MVQQRHQLESGILALESQRALLGDAVVDAAIAGLRARLDALPPAPAQALRLVSILFMDMVGSTALSERLDPEEFGAVVDGALARATDLVAAHGGKVLVYAGDNLLAAFGAQGSAEDDAERAVRCGLALLAFGRALGAEILGKYDHEGVDVRVGIHTGTVLLGGAVEQEDSIRGQAVNVAARMEQTAPAGALRITHDTYRAVEGAFDVAPQEPLRVKGVDEPVRSYLVLRARPRGLRAAARGIDGVETRMVARDPQFELLRGALARLGEPGSRLQRYVVVGEAGVGKSRLWQEVRARAQAQLGPCTVFEARATPQSQGQPYELVYGLVARYCGIHDTATADAARHALEGALLPVFAAGQGDAQAQADVHFLGRLIGLDYAGSPHVAGIRDDAREVRRRGFEVGAQLFRRLFAQQARPMVVYVDDLHWGDDGSLAFLDHLATACADLPMLVLASARPTLLERQAGLGTRIDLQPLDEGSSRLLAGELLRRLPQAPPALLDLLATRSGGNPFYMEELVKMLLDQGALQATDAGMWRFDAERAALAGVPATLTGVLQARLDSLPPQDREALQLASVIGPTFWDAALAHVDRRAASCLPALEAREVVHRSGAPGPATAEGAEYTFHHHLLHQVTYATVLKGVRRRVHAQVADWLANHAGTRRNSLEGVAGEHYEQAGDLANAAGCYVRAAEHLAGMFLHDSALDYTARALRLVAADDTEARWRLLANRERVLNLLGRREAQAADIEALDALAAAMPPGARGDARRADVAYRRADIGHRTGHWAVQEREARRALALAEAAGDEVLALRALVRLAQALADQGDPSAGKAIAEPALARARAAGLVGAQSGLLNALTVCTDLLGDRVSGLRSTLDDLALNQAAGHRLNEAVALSNVGMSYMGFGAFDEARRYLQDALAANRALGNRQVEGNVHAMLSELAWRDGKPSVALAHARQAHAISVEVDSPMHQADSLWSLGNAHAALGDWDAADDAFRRSEALARELGAAQMVLNAMEGRARTALLRGDEAQGRTIVEALLAEAGEGPPPAEPLAGTYEHLIRLTAARALMGRSPALAKSLLDESHARLVADAARIDDAALRHNYLDRIVEHREIARMRQRL